MVPVQNSSINPRAFINTATFISIAVLVGSTRLIQYFPGASTKGLLLSAGLGSTTVLGNELLFSEKGSDQNRCICVIACLALSAILTPTVAKKLTGRTDLNLRASFRFACIEAGIFGVLEALTKGQKAQQTKIDPAERKRDQIKQTFARMIHNYALRKKVVDAFSEAGKQRQQRKEMFSWAVNNHALKSRLTDPFSIARAINYPLVVANGGNNQSFILRPSTAHDDQRFAVIQTATKLANIPLRLYLGWEGLFKFVGGTLVFTGQTSAAIGAGLTSAIIWPAALAAGGLGVAALGGGMVYYGINGNRVADRALVALKDNLKVKEAPPLKELCDQRPLTEKQHEEIGLFLRWLQLAGNSSWTKEQAAYLLNAPKDDKQEIHSRYQKLVSILNLEQNGNSQTSITSFMVISQAHQILMK